MALAPASSSLKFSLFLLHPRRFPAAPPASSASPLLSSSPFSSPLPLSLPRAHVPLSARPLPAFSKPKKPNPTPRVLAVSDGEEKVLTLAEEEEEDEEEEEEEDDDDDEEKAEEDGAAAAGKFRLQVRPCELYACNLPRSTDISQLLDLFNRYGTVISVEVSRDAVTGISRGCGFVTMSSLAEAKAAISALDGSDLGGREMCVKFSADMVSGRKNTEALNTTPKKDIVFESPYKVYVGNLAWSVRPEGLREHFSQFGTVVSTRVLYDRKGGKNRVYGFLSFSSADEQKAAIESNGSVFHGRTMLVREVVNREEA
ncbi:33 kDa ribonucleoprotein, chloroplastic [Ananas comosus]|uniref:33 kDa ribonucleoprotein, chloroplastic n=1 Tax=Ananas comosus TaxID=4615 RepID=A0A199UF64_ANACO|nr:33 kDa ribonucleoprotein, chloroplastic [Ananas comosus]